MIKKLEQNPERRLATLDIFYSRPSTFYSRAEKVWIEVTRISRIMQIIIYILMQVFNRSNFYERNLEGLALWLLVLLLIRILATGREMAGELNGGN